MSFEKSTFSAQGNSCVEVWRKSGRSSANGCVEVTFDLPSEVKEADLDLDKKDGEPIAVLVRDSKGFIVRDSEGVVLAFTAAEWAAFLAGVHAGEFDLPPEAVDVR